MLFWIIAGILALAVAGLLALAVIRGRDSETPAAAYDLQVYRDQLKEVERDTARGVIGADEAERLRTEVSRRILAADTALHRESATQGGGRGARALALVAALAVAGGALGLYGWLGAPGYGDLPLKSRIAAAQDRHANRPTQAEIEARMPATVPAEPAPEYAELMEKLRETVAGRPGDLEGQQLLARNEAALGNLRAAYAAQEEVIRIKGENATAEDHVFLAELMISAAQGYVSPEAESSLRRALELERGNGAARYYMGLMLAQNDRPDLAFRMWESLLREGPSDASWMEPIRNQIEELAQRAGVEFTPPAEGAPAAPAPALPGPDAGDMQAAGDMSPAERMEMIRGMVSNLSDRLANEGGTPDEWARLIGAYGVLGEMAQARAIWIEAQKVFADRPNAMETVRSGARRAGLVE
ncbi:cytochrome c-type biogenesis protein CcmH [Salinihabitans flavidus]|uniref:Cytochrome c-type biogenesis protein CcmH n=1 Tax=Salinihabitans flavidus TaxID=569882 RepID=A0A1H8NLP5_9RHOB|nr:c-type cytochrome biogenesis protein CcmI [Salinihabitans flavidus]SEO30497.1 cytochrome c-type biogenesis protein CcmH [Salinihabitans flavidus]